MGHCIEEGVVGNQLEHLSVHVNYVAYVSTLWSYANFIIQEDETPFYSHLEV